MRILKHVSLILLIAMLLSSFVACNVNVNVDKDDTTTTEAPSTEVPTTEAPVTDAPTTEDPTTEAPTTEAPTTEAPTTKDPTTEGPTEDPDDGPSGDEPELSPAEKLAAWKNSYDIISIEEALEICDRYTTDASTERYYIIGTIKNISNPTYGEMTITDGTNELYVYGSYGADGVDRYSSLEEKPYKNDTVLLYCTLQTYNGTTKQAKSAWIIDFISAEKVAVDESQYTSTTIAEARNAAVGSKLSLTGVVAAITYANGMVPSGVYLVDGTQSIYIYSNDIAQRVKVGNKIKVIGTRENWILADEVDFANKFGYKGCCQLAEAYLISNDEDNTPFNKDWITETTVKEIVETPITENITTTIYKVNALLYVQRNEGQGFTNYYFYDLDGKTGTYTYTQCNGGDFTWLDKYDGKICTVYISALNAKSTVSGCNFRFLPIHVEDNNFTFDTSKAPEFVVKYHAVDQFMPTYTGDPQLELVTRVDSELLNFAGATISYTSNNTEVVYFTVDNGKTVMHCGKDGKATITITGSYNGNNYTQTVEITVDSPDEYEYTDVKTASGAAVGTEVTVKGIVGPGVTNKSGFYLIDETGSIAVQCDRAQFEGLMIGHEVIIRGTVDITYDGAGQLNIKDAVILVNYYGNNEYSTESFIKDKTIEEIKAVPDSVEATLNVYVVTAVVSKKSETYGPYTNITFNVGDVLLYSTGQQYAWLEEFFADGETSATLTVELALCEWNNKGFLRGCVLSVITDNGKVYNQSGFITAQ